MRVTVPGPDLSFQRMVKRPGFKGRASSATCTSSWMAEGQATVCSEKGRTLGGWFSPEAVPRSLKSKLMSLEVLLV